MARARFSATAAASSRPDSEQLSEAKADVVHSVPSALSGREGFVGVWGVLDQGEMWVCVFRSERINRYIGKL